MLRRVRYTTIVAILILIYSFKVAFEKEIGREFTTQAMGYKKSMLKLSGCTHLIVVQNYEFHKPVTLIYSLWWLHLLSAITNYRHT